MATPPVPPRPFESYDAPPSRKQASAPPVPPLPADFRPDLDGDYGSAPHFEDPLVAPRPHRLQPDLPANMARTLHDQATTPIPPPSMDYGRGRPPQSTLSPPAAASGGRDPSRGPNPYAAQGPEWSPWAGVGTTPAFPGYPQPGAAPYGQAPRPEDVVSSMAALALGPLPQLAPPPPQQHPRSRTTSAYGSPPRVPQPLGPGPSHHHRASTASATSPSMHGRKDSAASGPPSLTAPVPTIGALTSAMNAIQQAGTDPASQVAWCRDVLSLVNRAEGLHAAAANPTNVGASEPPVGPVRIGDQGLQRLVDVAVPLILKVSTPNPMPNPMPPWLAEAIYLRATCEASGAYPQYIPQSSRSAFRDFEQSARNGFYAAWFKLGRDYENFNDFARAKNCFERGVTHGDERSLYRMGMAHLMGQLNLQPSSEAAVPLLNRAATLATVEVPQPAYVYGLLLLNEFTHVSIAPQFFAPFIPAGSSAALEARKHLERAAYLNFAPAQYKLGHSYEFATPPFPFDPLLSVQYYSLASQQGEVEADMALSKWFLCGSEGAFEKDESLAFTFAEKAARKGLASAEFAMGYYAEVGVGGAKDLEAARRWYTKAAEHDNQDAKDRLAALSQPAPQSLSRTEHENLTESKLVRTRTQAKQRSDAAGARPPPMPAAAGARIVENVRKNSTMRPPMAAGPSQPPSGRSSFISEEPRPQGQGQGRPPQQYGSPSQHSARLPGGPGPDSTASPPPSASGAGRPYANAPRYSLADPGSSSAGGPRPPPPQQSQSFGPPGRRPNQSPAPSQGPPPPQPQGAQSPAYGSPVMTPPVGTPNGPPRMQAQTFADLGIATAKVEEKDCIVM